MLKVRTIPFLGWTLIQRKKQTRHRLRPRRMELAHFRFDQSHDISQKNWLHEKQQNQINREPPFKLNLKKACQSVSPMLSALPYPRHGFISPRVPACGRLQGQNLPRMLSQNLPRMLSLHGLLHKNITHWLEPGVRTCDDKGSRKTGVCCS